MNEDPIEGKVRHIENLVGAASNVANIYKIRRVGSEHLLYVIAGTEEGRRVIEDVGGNPRRIRMFLEKAFAETGEETMTGGVELTEDIKRVTMRPIRKARENARTPGLKDIFEEMLALGDKVAVLCQALIVGGVIESLPGRIEENFAFEEDDEDWEAFPGLGGDEIAALGGGADEDRASDHDSEVEPAPVEDTPETETCEHMRAVLQATRDLTALARRNALDDVIGREAEITRMIEILSKRKKCNIILSGEPGVGKTALAEGLAMSLVGRNAPDRLSGRPVLEVSLSDLVAGARFRGDFEARMQKLVDMAHRRRAILFLDEVHLMVGAGSVGGRGGMDAANILKPALARGDITVVGATTPSEMRDIRRDGALMRRFDMMTVSEPSVTKVRQIIDEAVGSYVAHHDILVEDDMLDLIVDLADRYLPAGKFPDKAFNVLDTSCVIAGQRGSDIVKSDDVRQAIERNGGTRLAAPDMETKNRVASLEAALSERVLGQPEAVKALARAARTAALGMSPGGTAGAYLFNGPTGVGKTEMARAFASAMNLPLVRIDMSEFMEKHSVSGLIGAPPGYVGHDRDGILIDAADRYSEMVLLFDEAEKAHPEVHDILLQVLDAGAVRSADGRIVSLAGAHVILSANIGARAAEKPAIGFGRENDELEIANEEIARVFRRELLGRIRSRVQFDRPDREACLGIVKKELDLASRRFADRGVTVVFEDGVAELLSGGSDLSYGMREVQDRIVEKVHDPLTTFLLETGAPGARIVLSADQEVLIRPLNVV